MDEIWCCFIMRDMEGLTLWQRPYRNCSVANGWLKMYSDDGPSTSGRLSNAQEPSASKKNMS
jgi:hypothetical protein